MRRRTACLGLLVSMSCGGDSRTELTDPLGFGDLEVRWTLSDPDGAPLTCEQADVAAAEVSLGRGPVTVDCDDADSNGRSVRFSDLAPGRFPLLIQLRNAQQALVTELITTLDVNDGRNVFEHDFVIDRADAQPGRLEVSWRLGGQAAAVACAAALADQVRVESQPGSIAPLQAILPCDRGELIEEDLRTGVYTLRFTLLDAEGRTLGGGVVQRNFEVRSGQTTRDEISFPLTPAPPAAVRFEWAINGRSASAECTAVGGQQIAVDLFEIRRLSDDVLIRTSTAACDRGLLTIANLVAPVDPDEQRFRVSADLRGFAGLVLTSTTLAGVVLRTAQTTTVAVDFGIDSGP